MKEIGATRKSRNWKNDMQRRCVKMLSCSISWTTSTTLPRTRRTKSWSRRSKTCTSCRKRTRTCARTWIASVNWHTMTRSKRWPKKTWCLEREMECSWYKTMNYKQSWKSWEIKWRMQRQILLAPWVHRNRRPIGNLINQSVLVLYDRKQLPAPSEDVRMTWKC